MNTAYIFDIDGTITPSRSLINKDFEKFFIEFQNSHDVYLVTGSDYPKSVEQIGPQVIAACKMMFSCCGNEGRIGDVVFHKSTWTCPPDLETALLEELANSQFPIRTGQHIEKRTGLVNFSIVGRGATRDQRQEYVKHDTEHRERSAIADRLAIKLPHIEFTIAGETGIDIYPQGADKSQVLDFIKADRTVFFGDMIVPGGNDWGIAQRCDQHYHVKSWMNTWQLLEQIMEMEKA